MAGIRYGRGRLCRFDSKKVIRQKSLFHQGISSGKDAVGGSEINTVVYTGIQFPVSAKKQMKAVPFVVFKQDFIAVTKEQWLYA